MVIENKYYLYVVKIINPESNVCEYYSIILEPNVGRLDVIELVMKKKLSRKGLLLLRKLYGT